MEYFIFISAKTGQMRWVLGDRHTIDSAIKDAHLEVGDWELFRLDPKVSQKITIARI